MKLISGEWPYLLPEVPRPLPVAYVVWFFWGLQGAHKLFLGRPLMALAYLFTGGFLGIGWLLDLFTLPWQVQWYELRRYLTRERDRPAAAKPPDLMQQLLQAARERQGVLTVTEGVLATGFPFKRVETALREMLVSGYVDVRNDPDSGVVQYVFPELRPSLH